MIVVDILPEISDQEKKVIETYFGVSSQDHSIENNSKRILTRILKRWYGHKSSSHPISNALIPVEYIALKIFYI